MTKKRTAEVSQFQNTCRFIWNATPKIISLVILFLMALIIIMILLDILYYNSISTNMTKEMLEMTSKALELEKENGSIKGLVAKYPIKSLFIAIGAAIGSINLYIDVDKFWKKSFVK